MPRDRHGGLLSLLPRVYRAGLTVTYGCDPGGFVASLHGRQRVHVRADEVRAGVLGSLLVYKTAVAVGTCLADEPSGLLAVAPSEALCRPVSAS